MPWDRPVMDCDDFVSWTRDNNYQKSPWCKIDNTGLSLLRNILIYDPPQRFTIKQIKQSTWYVKAHKPTPMPHHQHQNGSNNDAGFLSQPTHFYFNNTSTTNGSSCATSETETISMMSSELEVTDSQQDCQCSQSTVNHNHHHQQSAIESVHVRPGLNNQPRNAIESFSQPISVEHMFLNSQAMATQQTQTQVTHMCCFYPQIKSINLLDELIETKRFELMFGDNLI